MVVREVMEFYEESRKCLVALKEFVDSYETRGDQLQARPKEIEVLTSFVGLLNILKPLNSCYL